MLFRKGIEEIEGLRFIAARLGVCSPLGRSVLLDLPFLTSTKDINREIAAVARFDSYLDQPRASQAIEKIRTTLAGVRDIRGTVARLGSGSVLDEIELFELKSFLLACMWIKDELEGGAIEGARLPPLESALAVLDPEGAKIAHFHIHDSYSPALARVRARMREIVRAAESSDSAWTALAERNRELEIKIIRKLSERLGRHAGRIAHAVGAVARLDIVIAKARLNRELGLARPRVARTTTLYTALFNPEVKQSLADRGGVFQPVNIELGEGPTLLTGANMSGKTVLLHTLALAQAMFQFGFWVPATGARIVPVERIVLAAGDGQDRLRGLSSFAAEMLMIDDILAEARRGVRQLVLVDEPARTTNPDEGRAMVSALADILKKLGVRALLTTHYSNIRARVPKLRVRGFTATGRESAVKIEALAGMMDYSLVSDPDGAVPHEALRIAELIGVDSELLDAAKSYLEEGHGRR